MLFLALLACQSSEPQPVVDEPVSSMWAQLSYEGEILVDDPSLLASRPESRVVAAVSSDPSVERTLRGGDEEAAAAALLRRGARYLLLHRAAGEREPRSAAVISRLYHGDQRARFSLKAADDSALLYEVLGHSLELAPGQARVGAERVRARLAGREPGALRLTGLGPWDITASLRREGGQALVSAGCVAEDYSTCLDQLAEGLASGWTGEVPLAEVSDALILDLHYITERARVLEPAALGTPWEPGVDGLRRGRGAGAATAPGAWAFTRGCADAACQLALLGDAPGELWRVRDVHYQDRPGRGLIAMERGVPPLPLPLVDLGALESALALADAWYEARGEAPPSPAAGSGEALLDLAAAGDAAAVAAAYEAVDWDRPLDCEEPGLEQRVPLSVMAASAQYRVSGDEQAAERGLELARALVDACLWTPEDAPWADYAGGYRGDGRLPGVRSLALARAAAAAYGLALEARPSQAPFFETAARSSARFGMQLQYDEIQAYALDPAHRGGVRAALTAPGADPAATASLVSLLTLYLDAAREDPELPDGVRMSPVRSLLPEIGRGPPGGERR